MNTTVDESTRLSQTKELLKGATLLGLSLSASQLESMIQYLDLLVKWNNAFNLSGIKDPSDMVSLHLLDSLAVAPYLDGERVLDIGSGAGLPGIPLAIAYPHKKFILLDSNGKKTRFLLQVKMALGLDNITVENKRIEDYQCQEQIDIVISRAFSNLARMVRTAALTVKGSSRLLAMKGNVPTCEIEELPPSYKVSRIIKLQVPGIKGQRHLVEIPLH